MSNGPGSQGYFFDTNVLMDWQARFYPTDVFRTLISRIDELATAERFAAPELVLEELRAVGTTELIAWSGRYPNIWIPNAELLATAIGIQNRFPGLRDPKAEYDEADAYVIAAAQLRGGIVVTQETSAAEKRNPKRSMFIPDVCRDLGIPCIALLGMMRREGWTL
ncbi:MAG: DUF4411 family protein [Chthoniobacteraceae bacterium]